MKLEDKIILAKLKGGDAKINKNLLVSNGTIITVGDVWTPIREYLSVVGFNDKRVKRFRKIVDGEYIVYFEHYALRCDELLKYYKRK